MIENEILYNYFSGCATFQEEEKILNWLAEDSNNINLLHQERAIWDLIEFKGDAILEMLREEKKIQLRNRFASVKILLKIAAVFIIISPILFFYLMYDHNKENQNLVTNTIQVPKGKTIKIDLPDGTIVWLNSNTKFSYPRVFSTKVREVVLDGEAYFEVVHNAHWPFKVITSHQTVNVLGTVFNLNAFNKNSIFKVTLIKGSIRVNSNDAAFGIKPIILKPGFQLSFNKLSSIYYVKSVDANDYSLWKDGFYIFKNERFGDVINHIQDDTETRLIIKDTSLLSLKCNGKFYRSESVSQILDVLKETIPIAYSNNTKDNTILITKKVK